MRNKQTVIIFNIFVFAIIILINILLNNIVYAENYACEIILSYTGSNKIVSGEKKEIDIIARSITTVNGILLYNGILEYDHEKMDIEIINSEEWELYYQIDDNITLSRKKLENSNEDQVIGKMIITAKIDIEINYDSIKLIEGEVTDGNEIFETKESSVEGKELQIEIEEYTEEKEGENNYIKNIFPNSTIENVSSKIKTNGTIEIYKDTEKITDTSTKIGTGMEVRISLGDEVIIYKAVVKGDTDGDGEVKFNDILQINKHRLGKTEFIGIYLEAAEVTGDGIVDFKDILLVNKYRLGKINN